MSISDFWHSQHVPQVVPNGTIFNPITFAQNWTLVTFIVWPKECSSIIIRFDEYKHLLWGSVQTFGLHFCSRPIKVAQCKPKKTTNFWGALVLQNNLVWFILISCGDFQSFVHYFWWWASLIGVSPPNNWSIFGHSQCRYVYCTLLFYDIFICYKRRTFCKCYVIKCGVIEDILGTWGTNSEHDN